jgi:hypothetical protein
MPVPRSLARTLFQIVLEALYMMHSLMKDCHDTDTVVRKHLPVNEVMLIFANEPADAEFSRDGAPWKAFGGYGVETRKQPLDIALSLRLTPLIARIGIDFIDPVASIALDPKRSHARLRAELRAMTSSAVKVE